MIGQWAASGDIRTFMQQAARRSGVADSSRRRPNHYGRLGARRPTAHLLTVWLLAIYLGLSPVYWLPGIGVGPLRTVKMTMIVAALAFIWAAAFVQRGSVRLPRGLFGPLGFVLLIAVGIPGFYFAAPGEVSNSLNDFLMCYAMLWSVFIAGDIGLDLRRVLLLSCLIVVLFCLPVLTSATTGFPSLRAPFEFGATQLPVAGFGARRTGWSNGIALYVPIAFLFMHKEGSVGLSRIAVALALAGIIIATQLTVGGRAGVLASALAIIALALTESGAQRKLMFTFVVAVAALGVADLALRGGDGGSGDSDNRRLTEIVTHLRADRLAGQGTFQKWNSFSAGRLGAYRYGLGKAMERPFIGYGFGNAIYRGDEIHNLWLKLWLESGILLPITLLAGIVALVLPSQRQVPRAVTPLSSKAPTAASIKSQDSQVRRICAIIVAQGLLLSLFEPNALIGSFQATAMWWVAAGILCHRAVRATAVRPRKGLPASAT
jgi:hypothetical protein